MKLLDLAPGESHMQLATQSPLSEEDGIATSEVAYVSKVMEFGIFHDILDQEEDEHVSTPLPGCEGAFCISDGSLAGGNSSASVPPKNSIPEVEGNVAEEDTRKKESTYRNGKYWDDDDENYRQLKRLKFEVEKARMEQNWLACKFEALSMATDYCSGSVKTLRGFLSTSACQISAAAHDFANVIKWFGVQVLNPTDAQIETFVMSQSVDDLEQLSKNTLWRVIELTSQFDLATGAQKNSIAEKLENISYLRQRACYIMAKERPNDLLLFLHRRLLPPGDCEGRPNPKLQKVVESLEFSPDQLVSLKEKWQIYIAVTLNSRNQMRSLVQHLHELAGRKAVNSHCLGVASSAFLSSFDASSDLAGCQIQELRALCQLLMTTHTIFTPMQRCRMLVQTYPYFPDILQLCTLLFASE